MDIAPIYELKTRLRAAAIAGTNLLSEDFRLKRAAEAIKPLEAASPVFAKIGALTRDLLSPDKEDKEGILLDAVTLVDALLCTQGEVSVEEEISPLELQYTGSAINYASYSEIKSIIDALTNSGGGRYSYLLDTYNIRPELFSDYRVKPVLVKALGASYAELAENAAEWLKDMGESVIPLLKKDFDPKGKKEMLRRLDVIDELAGEKENDFYLSQLPEAEKEVRQALIYSLRHCPENEELLIGLTKTERGNAKKMAYYALAGQSGSAAGEVFEKLMEKKEEETLEYLEESRADWASEIVGKGFERLLEKLENKVQNNGHLNDEEGLKDCVLLGVYFSALEEKNSKVMCGCLRRAATLAQSPEFKKLKLKNTGVYYNRTIADSRKGITLNELSAKAIYNCIRLRYDEEVGSVALSLYEEYGQTEGGEGYFAAAALAKIIGEEDCTKWLWDELYKNPDLSEMLTKALGGLCWKQKEKAWVLENDKYNLFFNRYRECTIPVRQQIKGNFTQLLMGKREDGSHAKWAGKLDNVLYKCIPDGDKEYEDMVLEYFYKRVLVGALDAPSCLDYCAKLKKRGFGKCKGLGTAYIKKQEYLDAWHISNFLNAMPGTIEAKREEAKEMLELIKSGIGKRRRNINMERIEYYLDNIS